MQYHDQPYVPYALRQPKAFDAFNKEIVNAVTCCEAVEQTPWNVPMAQEVLRRARRRQGRATVRAVSLPSEPSCTQRFMAFEAKEDGHTTYIIAFRSDRECYNDIVSTPAAFAEVENENNFQVHKPLWWRAATMPLRSLPPQWRSGLREGRHRLLLTGFSVGGAVAALATLQLLEAEDPDLREQICCYTFGAPLQGDQKYANCINHTYASNFYHVMIDEDPIPGVLTLISKVAENKPDVSGYVVSSICKGLAIAAGAVLNVAVPGTGHIVDAIAHHIDFAKLGSGIKSLIATERETRWPLPEYRFGGSLVLLDPKRQGYNQMIFVQLLGDGRVLENVFCVQENHVTSSDQLRRVLDVHQLKTFCQVINNLNNSHLTQAIRSFPSVDQYHTDRSSREFPQRLADHSLDQINELVKDGAGRVAKSATNAAKSAARCVIPPNLEDDQTSSRYLLQPHFDDAKPIQVWLDNHENITIKVYGENMVLGIHVLYFQDGKEKLRVPCTEEYMPQWIENSKDPQKPMEQSFPKLPLHFSTQGVKGLTFKEPDGYFTVHLAFGSKKVPACQVQISMFDALDVLKVAERFSTEQPTNLIDLLIFWGMATAQAQCTAAFYAIQENPRDADDIVKKTIAELGNVPPEFALLDQLLALVDQSQFPPSVMGKLPPEMSITLRQTTNAAKSNLIVPLFSADDKESAAWTFGGCYKRTIQRLITKAMLSRKETAEQLAKSLDDELAAGPKQMVLAYLNHRLEYKEYAKEFSFKSMKSWSNEKDIAGGVAAACGIGGGVLTVVNLPILGAGELLDSNFLRGLGVAIGAPAGVLGAGLAGSAWFLYRVLSSPVRMLQNRPGLISDWTRSDVLADNYEKKLQAAALLFHREIEPPHVACKLEFELYKYLIDKIPTAGCFNHLSTMSIEKARCKAIIALQLANYGVAGAKMYEIRRYLTERKTALGLIGSSQAGKSTFASQAFNVESHPGAGKNARTRVLRHWNIELPRSRNRQFTLIDFPGSTDHAAPHWYIRGRLLASVLVVVLSLKEINSAQAVTLVEKMCKVRREDKEVSVLFCFTMADVVYKSYREEAEDMDEDITAAQLFTQNFESYKKELLDAASEAAGDAEQLAYIGSNMHACCFAAKLQERTRPLAQDLSDVKVKNMKWVKAWCLEKLLAINKSNSQSGSGSFSDC